MYDKSFKDFKNYFFKVWAVKGACPFFLDESDEPTFPLEWQKNVRVPRYTWEMLSEVERAFVVVIEDLWGKPPNLDTKWFLSDPSLVRAALGTVWFVFILAPKLFFSCCCNLSLIFVFFRDVEE